MCCIPLAHRTAPRTVSGALSNAWYFPMSLGFPSTLVSLVSCMLMNVATRKAGFAEFQTRRSVSWTAQGRRFHHDPSFVPTVGLSGARHAGRFAVRVGRTGRSRRSVLFWSAGRATLLALPMGDSGTERDRPLIWGPSSQSSVVFGFQIQDHLKKLSGESGQSGAQPHAGSRPVQHLNTWPFCSQALQAVQGLMDGQGDMSSPGRCVLQPWGGQAGAAAGVAPGRATGAMGPGDFLAGRERSSRAPSKAETSQEREMQ